MISIDEFRKFKENSKEYLRGYLRRYFKNSLKGNSNKKILVSILATNPLFLPLSMTLLGESLLLKLMFKEEFDAYNNYKSGSEFYKKKEYYKSLNFYKNAVKLDPNDADYKAHLADTYNKINKNNEAIDLYQEVIIILPENNEYRNKLISLYYQENRNDDVQNLLKKSFKENYLLIENLMTEEAKKHEQEKQILQQNIMQAVSHTLGNMLFVQKGITQSLSSSNHLENDIKRLQLFQTMTSSVLDSIKVAFGGNIDNNIEFFNEKNEENISLSSLFYFSLALNLENLLFGGQEWEKKRKNLLSINADNNEEIFAKLYEVKDNSKFQILELSDEIILDFKDFFESKDFEFIGKYFEVNVDVLNNVFVKKDSYSFAIIFVIFQELIKNMFKYGSTKTNNDVIFKIIANNNEKIELIFENSFLNSKTKNKIGTLKGLKMIEMFAKVLGGFKDNSNDEMFSIKIEIDNKFFEKE